MDDPENSKCGFRHVKEEEEVEVDEEVWYNRTSYMHVYICVNKQTKKNFMLSKICSAFEIPLFLHLEYYKTFSCIAC